MQKRAYIVQPPVCEWPATWSSASLRHGQAYHKTSSTKLLVDGESGYVQARGKWHHFEHLLNWNRLFSVLTLHNRLFSEPPTVYQGKHVFSHQFYRSYLKANKVSKSGVIRKVEYAYHFWKCADAVDRKLAKLLRACRNYSLSKLVHFLSHRLEATQKVALALDLVD